MAVQANPTIIIIQTVVAAGARRDSATRLDISTSNEVPQALTPNPINMKAKIDKAIPWLSSCAIQTVERLAKNPPKAKTDMPPIIQGVHRLP